jgi:hypothetical protein
MTSRDVWLGLPNSGVVGRWSLVLGLVLACRISGLCSVSGIDRTPNGRHGNCFWGRLNVLAPVSGSWFAPLRPASQGRSKAVLGL